MGVTAEHTTIWQKILAVVVAFVMVFSMSSISAWADDGTEAAPADEAVQVDDSAVDESEEEADLEDDADSEGDADSEEQADSEENADEKALADTDEGDDGTFAVSADEGFFSVQGEGEEADGEESDANTDAEKADSHMIYMSSAGTAQAAETTLDNPTTLLAAVNYINSAENDGKEYVISLTEDVTHAGTSDSDTLSITGQVRLLGNGHTLTITGGSIKVQSGACLFLGQNGGGNQLTLLSAGNSAGSGVVNLLSGAEGHMYDGVTVQCAESSSSFGIWTSGSFSMHGGTVTGFHGDMNAVRANLSGCFVMEGGQITGCNLYRGGAVSVVDTGSAEIRGGKIYGNESPAGAALYVNTLSAIGVTTTKGPIATIGGSAELYNNTAANGGAIYVGRTPCKVTVSGGYIHNNEATGNGGGVYVGTDDNWYNPGTFIYESGRLLNNAAAVAGADVYLSLKGSIQLCAIADENKGELDGCGHTVDGWFADTQSDRWSENARGRAMVTKYSTLKTKVSTVAVKAAHYSSDYEVYGTYEIVGVDGTTTRTVAKDVKLGAGVFYGAEASIDLNGYRVCGEDGRTYRIAERWVDDYYGYGRWEVESSLEEGILGFSIDPNNYEYQHNYIVDLLFQLNSY